MPVMKIAIGCDHGAYELKDIVAAHLKNKGIEIVDFGTFGPDSVHYPGYAHKVCESVQKEECTLGILLCSTGVGMSIAANKHKGIRAALCTDTYTARFTRMHNDSNVLCMGALVVGRGLALDIVDAFISAEFEGGRHGVRVGMLCDIEKGEFGNL